MISIVNPSELEQVLRPTVYRPPGQAPGASRLTRELGDEIRPHRRPLVAERVDQHGVAQASAATP